MHNMLCKGGLLIDFESAAFFFLSLVKIDEQQMQRGFLRFL